MSKEESTVQLPISPSLKESMDLLKALRSKMETYNNSNGNYHDAITENYNKIEVGINSIAWALSEIMGYEIRNKYFDVEEQKSNEQSN